MSLKVNVKCGAKTVPLERISAGNVEAEVEAKIARMLIKYAPQITERARQILRSEIKRPLTSTGRLAGSIRYRITGHNVTIYAGAPHALWVEEDTRPHIIRPRLKKVLHWMTITGLPNFLSMAGIATWQSQAVITHHFAMRVRHPGTKGKRMMRRAVDEYRPIIKAEMLRMISEGIAGGAGQ